MFCVDLHEDIVMYDVHINFPKLSLDLNKSKVAVGIDQCAHDVT